MQSITELLTTLNDTENPDEFIHTICQINFITPNLEQSPHIYNAIISNIKRIIAGNNVDNVDPDFDQIYPIFTNKILHDLIQKIISFPNFILDPASIKVFMFAQHTMYNTCTTTLANYIAANKKITIDLSQALFSTFTDNNFYSSYSINEFINEYATNIEADSSILEIACKYHLEEFIKCQIDKRIPTTQQCLYYAISNNDLPLCKTLLLTGCVLDITCLETACTHKQIDMVIFIMTTSLTIKPTPTQQCFNAIFVPTPIHHNMGSLSKFHQQLPKLQQQLVDLLIAHNFNPTTSDLILATQHKVIIPNFTKLNIPIPDNFYTICKNNSFYPFEAYNLPLPTEALEHACLNSNLQTVKQLIASGIQPTTKCLQLACTKKNNANIIKFLLETSSIIPDIQSLKSLVATQNNTALTCLVDKFCASYTLTALPLPPPKIKSPKKLNKKTLTQ